MTLKMADVAKGGIFKAFLIFGTALIGIALILVLGEVGCRLAGIPFRPVQEVAEGSLARFDPVLGWSYLPNSTKVQKHSLTGQLCVMHFDARGIRVPSQDFKFDPSPPSVLFIGCSFTMGHGVSYEESLPGQFQRLAGKSYQVVNLGVQAYGSDQALLMLKRYIGMFNTKAVVYTFVHGEYDGHVIRNGNYDRRLLYPQSRYVGTKPLFRLDMNGRIQLDKKPVQLEHYPRSYLWSLVEMRLKPRPVELTRRLIQEMERVSESYGAAFFMVDWRWDRNEKDLFAGLGIDIVDTRAIGDPTWVRMRIVGDGHPNGSAYREVAELLFEEFQRKGIWVK